MQKIDNVVIRETGYVAIWVLIFSTMMQSIFLIAGFWDYRVLLGNLYGGAVAVVNYFSIGLSVQKALGKEDPNEAKQVMKLASSARMLMLFIFVVIGVLLDFFNTIAVVVPLVFPRLAIFLRPFCGKMAGEGTGAAEGNGDGLSEDVAEGRAPTENENTEGTDRVKEGNDDEE
ncbi:MAG: hypothetical protein IKB34_03025 [Clostridia bacterium]|nr:hypothetical protein [Clostridia bacterium]